MSNDKAAATYHRRPYHYVRERVMDDGRIQYCPACHRCNYGDRGPWTYVREAAQINANLHKDAHAFDGELW